MSIQVRVYDNGDHTGIIWLPDGNKPIANCRGFAVQRKSGNTLTFLCSFVGFEPGQAAPAQGKEWQWPLQRYMWWDYGVKPGATVSYQVTAVVGDADDLKLDQTNQSDWTAPLTVTGQSTAHISAWFNKGIVASQWVSRALDKEAPSKKRQPALQDLLQKTGDPLRDELGGLLKEQILDLLADAKGAAVYAALYELNDKELLKSMLKLGKSLHLVLANGSFNSKKPDENVDARKQLKGSIDLHNRMVTSGHFAHNKFAVFCDKSGKPQKVLTGSTNWTWSGLCSQANNGLIISDEDVSQAFLDEWNRVEKAGNGYPATLATANSKLRQFQVDDAKVTTWFAPTKNEPDMDYARKLIANAKDGILFLFFNPGTVQTDPEKETLLQDILQRHDSTSKDFDGSLYIKGVVNQEIKGLTDALAPKTPVSLFADGKSAPQHLNSDAMIPANIKQKFSVWEDEALKASLVMVHSKVVVLDPFGDYPVVMTGSHNLGLKASSKNDDNLVILEGPAAAPIAAAYALNIIGIYQTYRWNTYVTQHDQDPAAWHGLQDTDTWQSGHLTGDNLSELRFWMATHLDGGITLAAGAGAAGGSSSKAVRRPPRGHINRA